MGWVKWMRSEGDQAGAGVFKWQERMSKATAKVGTIHDPSFSPWLSAEATCGSHDKSTCLGIVWWMVMVMVLLTEIACCHLGRFAIDNFFFDLR